VTYHLITYATSIYLPSANTLLASGLQRGFDMTKLYTPSDLEDHFKGRNHLILKQPRGAGLYVWKPYVVFHYLTWHAKESDIVCFIDAGLNALNPSFDLRNMLHSWTEHTPHVGIASSYPGKWSQTERKFTKKDTFLLMNVNISEHETERGGEIYQNWGGFFVARKTDSAINFAAEWLTYSQDERIINDEPSSILQDDPSYIENRHDQSVLSVLALKWHIRGRHVPWGVFGRVTDYSELINDIRNSYMSRVPKDENGNSVAAVVNVPIRGSSLSYYFDILQLDLANTLIENLRNENRFECPVTVTELLLTDTSQLHNQKYICCENVLQRVLNTQAVLLDQIVSKNAEPHFVFVELVHENSEVSIIGESYKIPTKNERNIAKYIEEMSATISSY
jgi:hypothetical protein